MTLSGSYEANVSYDEKSICVSMEYYNYCHDMCFINNILSSIIHIRSLALSLYPCRSPFLAFHADILLYSMFDVQLYICFVHLCVNELYFCTTFAANSDGPVSGNISAQKCCE